MKSQPFVQAQVPAGRNMNSAKYTGRASRKTTKRPRSIPSGFCPGLSAAVMVHPSRSSQLVADLPLSLPRPCPWLVTAQLGKTPVPPDPAAPGGCHGPADEPGLRQLPQRLAATVKSGPDGYWVVLPAPPP